MALDYAARGERLGIAARRVDKLAEISRQYPGQIDYSNIDVTVPDATERFHQLIAAVGGMDTLIYCVGTGFRDTGPDMDRTDMTVRTNVDGFTAIITAAYHYFHDNRRERKGCIAVITSIAATKGIGVSAAYSASKSFEQKYIEALAQLAHMQHVNVTLTDIRPGFIGTDLLDESRSYPMLMSVEYAARRIERAIDRRKQKATIDWRWRMLTLGWRLVPRWLWTRLHIDF